MTAKKTPKALDENAAKTSADALTKPVPPPATLSPDAAVEWNRLIGVLAEIGTARHADLRSFELLCEVLATERQLRESITREGFNIETADGNPKANPSVKLLDSTRNQAHRMLSDFGLVPKGRVSVKPTADPKKTEVSPWEKFMRPTFSKANTGRKPKE